MMAVFTYRNVVLNKICFYVKRNRFSFNSFKKEIYLRYEKIDEQIHLKLSSNQMEVLTILLINNLMTIKG